MTILLECYYQVFLKGEIYKEKELYELIKDIAIEPDVIWIKIKLLTFVSLPSAILLDLFSS